MAKDEVTDRDALQRLATSVRLMIVAMQKRGEFDADDFQEVLQSLEVAEERLIETEGEAT
jgi:hypothetical protein